MSRTVFAVLALGLELLAACQHDAAAPPTRSGGLAEAAAAPDPLASAVTTTVHGVNFQIKSQADQSFCIEAESGTSEGRTFTMQQCGLADTQRWALPWNSDDTDPIVDSQGMCVDGHFTKGTLGVPLTVAKCQSGDNWRFAYTSQATIENVKNHKCFQIPQAAANAWVALADCDPTKQTQLWVFAH